jgi:hypothetical protein
MTISKNGRAGLLCAGADLQNPAGPDGAPINPNWSFDTKWHFNWTNYDDAYYTDLSKDQGSTVYIQLGPGVTQYGSEYSQDFNWVVRHVQGGISTEWVGVF